VRRRQRVPIHTRVIKPAGASRPTLGAIKMKKQEILLSQLEWQKTVLQNTRDFQQIVRVQTFIKQLETKLANLKGIAK
jgi:hypothetical protein